MTATRTEMFIYLDDLRESGVTNMYGATPFLQRRFGIAEKQARKILVQWMETFSDETPAQRAMKVEDDT